jgi:hypothetical protein
MGVALRLMIYMVLFNIAVGILFFVGTGAGAGDRTWRVTGQSENTYLTEKNNIYNQFNTYQKY